MTITALPPAPSRASDPATFSSDADAFVAALGLFRTEANALAVDANADAASADIDAATATEQAAIATTKAAEAAASAASALTNSTTSATSTTSITIGSGSKTFTLAQTGKAFVIGQWVSISDSTTPSTKWMLGAITAFNSGTGAITVEAYASVGGGSGTSWVVAASAPPVGVADTTHAAVKIYSQQNFFGF